MCKIWQIFKTIWSAGFFVLYFYFFVILLSSEVPNAARHEVSPLRPWLRHVVFSMFFRRLEGDRSKRITSRVYREVNFHGNILMGGRSLSTSDADHLDWHHRLGLIWTVAFFGQSKSAKLYKRFSGQDKFGRTARGWPVLFVISVLFAHFVPCVTFVWFMIIGALSTRFVCWCKRPYIPDQFWLFFARFCPESSAFSAYCMVSISAFCFSSYVFPDSLTPPFLKLLAW